MNELINLYFNYECKYVGTFVETIIEGHQAVSETVFDNKIIFE